LGLGRVFISQNLNVLSVPGQVAVTTLTTIEKVESMLTTSSG